MLFDVACHQPQEWFENLGDETLQAINELVALEYKEKVKVSIIYYMYICNTTIVF